MRDDNMAMLRETLEILDRGSYTAGDRTVKLKLGKSEMTRSTVLLPEDVRTIEERIKLKTVHVLGRCGYDCVNTDSFSAAISLDEERSLTSGNDEKPALVLNFANPVNPGGGVRRGARAQEEDLCRKSSLLPALESGDAREYYIYNRNLDTYMGSDAMILTPSVEIIRDYNGDLLADTRIVAVLTCAAPMIKLGKEGMTGEEYRQMLLTRITGMLRCAAAYGYKRLVLGAWGCGAFGNDAALVSDLFYRALKELTYCGMTEKDLFSRIVFAVLSRTPDQYNFRQFERNFAGNNFYRDEDREDAERVKEKIKGTEQ